MRRSEAGFSLVAVAASIAIMTILMGVAVPTWRYVMQNARGGADLPGGQIADAIERYQKKHGNTPPVSLDVLVKGKFLRKAYKDPMTEKGQWRFIRPGEARPDGHPAPGVGGACRAPAPRGPPRAAPLGRDTRRGGRTAEGFGPSSAWPARARTRASACSTAPAAIASGSSSPGSPGSSRRTWTAAPCPASGAAGRQSQPRPLKSLQSLDRCGPGPAEYGVVHRLTLPGRLPARAARARGTPRRSACSARHTRRLPAALGALAAVALAARAEAKVTRYLTGNAADVHPRSPAPRTTRRRRHRRGRALQWLIDQVRGCTACPTTVDVVILRSAGADGYNDYIYEMNGVDSVRDPRDHRPCATRTPPRSRPVRNAEVVFFAGGDQCNYVEDFRGTRSSARSRRSTRAAAASAAPARAWPSRRVHLRRLPGQRSTPTRRSSDPYARASPSPTTSSTGRT